MNNKAIDNILNQNYESTVIIEKIVQNILKLFNKTTKYEKYAVLSVLSDIFSKKELRYKGFVFSNTMYKTSKRKINDTNIEDRCHFYPKSKKIKGDDTKKCIVQELNNYSQITSKMHRNQNVYNLEKPKLYIYNKIKENNPQLSLSMSKFYQLCPKNYKYCKNKTDMCTVCVNGQRMLSNTKTNKEPKKEKYYYDHLKLKELQKKYYKEKVYNLKEKECIVIMDFKENFKIGGGPVENSQTFYNKSQVSCLGVCITYMLSGQIKRKYVNFMSNIIKHDSFYVIQCLKKLEKSYLSRFSNVHFWSDNAGHFRSAELKKYILKELPSRNYIVSLNYFLEYHGKSDVDAHFGLLQKVFNFYEKRKYIYSIYDLYILFIDYFETVETDAHFEIYEEENRREIIEKLRIKDSKYYMSFYADSEHVYGNSLSSFVHDQYKSLEYNIVFEKENRESKKAPRLSKNDEWELSSYKYRIMENRMALAT